MSKKTASKTAVIDNAAPAAVSQSSAVEETTTTTAPETAVNTGEIQSGTIAEDTTKNAGEEILEEEEEILEEEEEAVEEKTESKLSAKTQELLAKVEASGDTAAFISLQAVLAYMEAMKPGNAMSIEEGARNQANLYRAIRNVIESSGDSFQLAFTTLLRIFDEQADGVFNEMYVFRFIENLTLNHNDQAAFKRIVNLIKVAAPVQGRAEALRQVDFTKSLQFGFSDAGKQRVLTYFNV